MNKFWPGLLFLLLVVLAGCRGGNLNGPPATGSQPPGGTFPAQLPEPVAVTDLAASPADYEGHYLEVSGLFQPAPVIACETKAMRSPATWGLAEEEQTIAATGPGGRFPQIRDDQQALSVTGYWRRWYGAVGCGREAPVREVWYLDVDRLLSPNPIALVATAAVSDTSGSPAGSPESEEGLGLDLTLTPVTTATLSPPAPPPLVTTPAGVPAGASSPTSGSPVVTLAANPNLTASAGAATNPAPTQTSITATPAGGTPAPGTPIPGTTATAAATPGAAGTPTIEDQIDLSPGSLETGFLDNNQIDRWPIVITATTAITVNLASELGLDVAFQVRDSDGNILAEQDGAADGQPEFGEDIELPAAGTFELLISSPDNGRGAYAVLINSEESYFFRSQGTVGYGDAGSGSLLAYNDHIWHFSGTAGDTITVVVTPGGDFNMFIRLFGPDALTLVDFHDDTGSGEAETLVFSLVETGFYSLVVGEFDYQVANYQISLSGE